MGLASLARCFGCNSHSLLQIPSKMITGENECISRKRTAKSLSIYGCSFMCNISGCTNNYFIINF